MTFLAPIAWGLLALGIPIIALYLIKTRLRRKPVSTLLFWGQLKPPVYNSSLWRKLRRWVSLALQLLFLALLVFALAEPLARWQSAKAGAAVLVIDPSPSMWATDVAPSRWAQAMDLAHRRIAALRLSDECALILASDPPRVLSGWTGSQRTLRRALDSAAPLAGREGIRPALALARNLAGSRAGSRIIVITDGAWAEPPDAAALADAELNFIGSSKPVNTALTAFAARRSLAAPGDFTLAAEVRHFGEGPVDGELEIQRDGHIMDLQPLRLEPGKPWQKTWKSNADAAVKFEARLRTFAPGAPKNADAKNAAVDQLAADNHAEARLEAVAPVSVDLVAPPNAFLDAALGSLPAITHRRRAVGELDPRAPAALTIFYHVAPPANFSETAAALLIDPPGGGFWGEPTGGDNTVLERPLVSDYLRDSAPLRFVSLDSVSLQKAREFRPAPGAEIFAQSFGKPLLFGRWDAGAAGGSGDGVRRWLVMPFDLENTDFALRTAFPVLLGNLTQSLRAGAPSGVEPLPGEIKSRLTRTAELPAANAGGSSPRPLTPPAAWWAWAPLWWWAAVLGLGWLLAEWWSFSRRITE